MNSVSQMNITLTKWNWHLHNQFHIWFDTLTSVTPSTAPFSHVAKHRGSLLLHWERALIEFEAVEPLSSFSLWTTVFVWVSHNSYFHHPMTQTEVGTSFQTNQWLSGCLGARMRPLLSFDRSGDSSSSLSFPEPSTESCLSQRFCWEASVQPWGRPIALSRMWTLLSSSILLWGLVEVRWNNSPSQSMDPLGLWPCCLSQNQRSYCKASPGRSTRSKSLHRIFGIV